MFWHLRGGCLRRNRSPKPGPDPEPGLLNDGLHKRVDLWAWRRVEVAGHADIGADGQDGTISVIRADVRWLEPFEWLLMGLWLCLWLCTFGVEQAGKEANDVDLDVKAYARGGGG